MPLMRIPRQVFINEIWDHRRGEHVLFAEPTQQGKTHLGFQLLGATDHAKPPIALVMKPRDATPAKWSAALGYKETPVWPPAPSFGSKPPGYTLWPKHTLGLDPASIDTTNKNLETQFRRALLDAYGKGDRIVFVDEILGLVEELGLSRELSMLWTRGAGMGASLWSATQKPSGTRQGGGIPGHAFNAPTHLFFGRDLDPRNRQRFGEIGGVDPGYVSAAVAQLRINQIQTSRGIVSVSDKLYIDKRGNHNGPYMCVISP